MPPLPRSDRLYLPEIDGLRFVAFFLVLIHHVVSAHDYFPGDSWLGGVLTRVATFGWIGVDIFLTLSSFLIVTLLTIEREKTKTISISKFYIRRALRIWPLYFSYVLFAVLLLPLALPPSQPYTQTIANHLFPYLTFTDNFAYAYFPVSGYAAHMWTISLEEQFYLCVPVLVLFAPALGRSLKWWAFGLMILTAAFRLYIQLNQVKYPMIWVLPACRLDPFIVGAFCSWAYMARRRWLDLRIGWLLALLGIAGFALIMQSDRIDGSSVNNVWQFTVIAMSSGLLLLAAVARAGIGPILSWSPLVFLGKISYGLYVYHFVVIIMELRLVQIGARLGRTPLVWLLVLATVLGATALLATLSYYGFERAFVRLKGRYERVKSRPA